jgi:excinuclease ABC subunit C
LGEALDVREQIERFAHPGVYLMKDTAGRIVYVGKAKNLRNRVRQYYRRPETHAIISVRSASVVDIDFLPLIQKRRAHSGKYLIKKHKPRFNINCATIKTTCTCGWT